MPPKPGLYWLARYDGHGEYRAVLSRVSIRHTAEQLATRPKPTLVTASGAEEWKGDDLTALCEWEEANERKELYMRFLDSFDPHKAHPVKGSWTVGYKAVKEEEVPVSLILAEESGG